MGNLLSFNFSFFDTLNTGDTEELVVTSNINNELKTRIEKQVERKFSRITNTNFNNNLDLFITCHLGGHNTRNYFIY